MQHRYARQEALPVIGATGQRRLGRSTVAVFGVGAIGTVSAELLARAGIGSMVLADRDIVELHNLHRQTLFTETDVGVPKAIAARERLQRINSGLSLRTVAEDIDHHNVNTLHADIILDCTDNLEARFLLDDYCRKHRVPWVHAAAIRSTAVVFPVLPGHASFRALFGASAAEETCETAGVLSTATSLAASLQVTEALRILLGSPQSLLLRYDVWTGRMDRIAVPTQQQQLPYDYLSGAHTTKTTTFCGNGVYQLRGRKQPLAALARTLRKTQTVRTGDGFIAFSGMTLFADGRALIHARSAAAARALHARFLG